MPTRKAEARPTSSLSLSFVGSVEGFEIPVVRWGTMNKSPESPIFSNEHYKILQLDQVGRDDKSLREFNAELLQRVGDYRKKNLELAGVENTLKSELAVQTKQFAERERELTTKFQRELDLLKKSIEDDRITNEQAVEEWNRKLAKLSDESWAKGLEIEGLRRTESEIQEKILKLQEQVARTLASEASQRSELEAALESEETLRVQLEATHKELDLSRRTSETLGEELAQEKKSGAQALLTLKSQLEQVSDAFRKREAELITAFEALRVEYSNIDTCYKEANEATAQIRSELRIREDDHQARLIEQEKNLRAGYLAENNDMIAENSKLREMLSVRDVRLDQDRAALQTWREQLGYLDQHLRQLSDSIKKDRAEVLRTAKAVSEEVQFNLTHPFTEYLEIAEKEVSQLETQLVGMSAMSPQKTKHEARLTNAKSHRDGIVEILDHAKGGLSEHAKSIQAIVKNLETLTV